MEGELEHLRSVLKMDSYPKKFIDNAMKTRQQVREKTEYQSSVSLPYIGAASHKIERILKKAGIHLYHSSENKLFRSLCIHKDTINEFQKPGVYRIPCECGLVYIGETGQNLSLRLKEHKTNCEKEQTKKSNRSKSLILSWWIPKKKWSRQTSELVLVLLMLVLVFLVLVLLVLVFLVLVSWCWSSWCWCSWR